MPGVLRMPLTTEPRAYRLAVNRRPLVVSCPGQSKTFHFKQKSPVPEETARPRDMLHLWEGKVTFSAFRRGVSGALRGLGGGGS